MKRLVCKSVKFRSNYDRRALLKQFARISLINKITFKNNNLYLHLGEIVNANDDEIRALICLFWRYGVNMRQLAIFLTPANKNWMNTPPKAYWDNMIFGKGSNV